MALAGLLLTAALPAPIVIPSFLRITNRDTLSCFAATPKQDHQFSAVEAEIHPIARPKVDPHFMNAAADTLER